MTRIQSGTSILVGTLGRLLDFKENKYAYSVAETEFLILDEADRLLDLGFRQRVWPVWRSSATTNWAEVTPGRRNRS